jgi:transketolase
MSRPSRMRKRGFSQQKLDQNSIAELTEKAKLARGDILTMTTLAGCGHPGGSMSSVDAFLVLFNFANVNPEEPLWQDRDRIIISHGHTSPGTYAALARSGFFPPQAAVPAFRQVGAAFEGHVERGVPGVEWSTGNLGQGLSAACGFAIGARLLKKDYQVYTVMGCGEQQKGQLSEARRFAVKYGLTNITALVDYNNRQICGKTREIMPQDIPGCYQSDGWEALEVDGHDFQAIYQALRKATHDRIRPYLIMLNTVMGKGVSFMEGDAKYHGVALNEDQFKEACRELGIENRLEEYRKMRESREYPRVKADVRTPGMNVQTGKPRDYARGANTDNRSAWGKALDDMAELNMRDADGPQMAVFDCDLAGSVKVANFEKNWPDNFFQGGVAEHNAATAAGALSIMPVLTYFADFGVFGSNETFNQHRLNAINHTNLKVAITHNGLDVGEDGKTHHCLEYVGLARNLFGYKVIVPADPNQTDRAARYMSRAKGNFFLCMGRSKVPVILDENGEPFFTGEYEFEYGKIEKLREGDRAAIIAMGSMTWRAVKAWEMLKDKGVMVKVLNASCPLDLDPSALKEAAQTGLIITYEDHNVHTGLGCEVAKALAQNRISIKLKCLGVPAYASSGKPDHLLKEAGIDIEALVHTCLGLLDES